MHPLIEKYWDEILDTEYDIKEVQSEVRGNVSANAFYSTLACRASNTVNRPRRTFHNQLLDTIHATTGTKTLRRTKSVLDSMGSLDTDPDLHHEIFLVRRAVVICVVRTFLNQLSSNKPSQYLELAPKIEMESEEEFDNGTLADVHGENYVVEWYFEDAILEKLGYLDN